MSAAAAGAGAGDARKGTPVPGVSPDTICVAGAGLVGCMIALMLGRRGLPVRLIERRDDLRVKKDQKDDDVGGRLANSAKRSINLALSHRGICALKHVQLLDVVKPWLVTMKGRYIHGTDGAITFQPYGVGDQANYSVSRADLNALLLTECEKLKDKAGRPLITTSFDERVSSVDGDATVHSSIAGQHHSTRYRLVIGADGAFSTVRSALMRLLRMDYSQQHINAVYKELTIPATAKGEYAMANSEGLHIWSRHEFMLIALPNPDRTFTGTLFAPADGAFGLKSLTTKESVLAFFNTHFPDAVPLMPNLVTEFFESPTAPLLTVRCAPWYHSDKIVLMGDAAHAIVPFLGQGMNAGFEDALIFDELWDKCGGDVAAVLRTFGETRKPSTDALADLSYANFKEMASHTASAAFLAKKKFESVLYRVSPSLWTPLYTMITYTRTPYHEAVVRARKQDRALNLAFGGLLAAALGGAGYYLWHNQSLWKRSNL